jgi:hypothetical protein
MIATSNEYLKYLPLDSGTTKYLSPILDFTSSTLGTASLGAASAYYGGENPILSLGGQGMETGSSAASVQRLQESGKKATKRSVSETKKKFVAARQNWKCGDCNNQLSAWFEVDHKVRLEYGGSNHIDNLVALCRECHGKKTAMENL